MGVGIRAETWFSVYRKGDDLVALDAELEASVPVKTATLPRTAAALRAELDSLRELGPDALRARWKELFGAEVSRSVPSYKLARAIAYRLQAAYHGEDACVMRGTFQFSRLTDGVGTPLTLRRFWKGEDHEVTREGEAFYYRGSRYASLSAVARAITGTRWNGWTFFGLKSPPQTAGQGVHG